MLYIILYLHQLSAFPLPPEASLFHLNGNRLKCDIGVDSETFVRSARDVPAGSGTGTARYDARDAARRPVHGTVPLNPEY